MCAPKVSRCLYHPYYVGANDTSSNSLCNRQTCVFKDLFLKERHPCADQNFQTKRSSTEKKNHHVSTEIRLKTIGSYDTMSELSYNYIPHIKDRFFTNHFNFPSQTLYICRCSHPKPCQILSNNGFLSSIFLISFLDLQKDLDITKFERNMTHP
ncbi:hypothetical protein YC2023_000919 [Brassica napus]